MKSNNFKLIFCLNLLVILQLSSFSQGIPSSNLFTSIETDNINLDITESIYNKYSPNGNISILVAVDSHLLGTDKFFIDKPDVKYIFESWLTPLEKRFNISFHVLKVTAYTPSENDSLDTSIVKVANTLSWNFAETQDAPTVDGNNYDFLIIYQEEYWGGQNRANSVNGNALIIAHNQPFSWVSRQLILLHEVGHIFGATHQSGGIIPAEWFGSSELSMMDYSNLSYMTYFGWNRDEIPIDDHNFNLINSSRYRFDRNDADLDSLPNYYEFRFGLDPSTDDTLEDLDNDGLNNIDEYNAGTNPAVKDSDSDSYSDWAEDFFGSSPLNTTDLPLISDPVIFSESEDQTIFDNETANLKWRAIAQVKDSYSIYANDSLIEQGNWNNEIIEHTFSPQATGKWEISCVVTDIQGHDAQASIWVNVQRSKIPGITSFMFTWISLVILLVFARFRVKKENK